MAEVMRGYGHWQVSNDGGGGLLLAALAAVVVAAVVVAAVSYAAWWLLHATAVLVTVLVVLGAAAAAGVALAVREVRSSRVPLRARRPITKPAVRLEVRRELPSQVAAALPAPRRALPGVVLERRDEAVR